ncbi:MAG TPA: hypothetical protein VHH11_14020 [Gammaproteobacteria bacterium]|nr:hypothetical protein [Gammaproteobacteria bacterium]
MSLVAHDHGGLATVAVHCDARRCAARGPVVTSAVPVQDWGRGAALALATSTGFVVTTAQHLCPTHAQTRVAS